MVAVMVVQLRRGRSERALRGPHEGKPRWDKAEACTFWAE